MNLANEAGEQKKRDHTKKSRWRYAGWLFLFLLLVSHIIRWSNSATISLLAGQEHLQLRVVDKNRILDDSVTTAYRLLQPDLSSEAHPPPTLILLHGSPMASTSMMALARALPDSLRILVPDLPGFGRSSLQLPDYSVAAHAVYLIQLMDSLGIDEAHLIAYSMGGGVAIEAYDKAPERIKSIVMLSGLGVQEQELLGSYAMNHAVHGLQLAFLWSLQELLPHMGYMDDALLNVSYARNFYDTDQRPLRDILNRYEPPMLILHGSEDMQVPLSAALEHKRIVPQSTLVQFEGGHGLVFNPSQSFMDTLNAFILSVEKGAALRRANASPQRITAAAAPVTKDAFPKAEGLTMLVYLLLISLATLVTEDGASIGAGLLVAQGTLRYLPAMLACLTGIVVGDVLLFLAGKYISKPLLSRAPFRWFFSKDAIDSAAKWVNKRGAVVIIASRFIPGSRLPTYVAAGSLGLSIWKFLFYFIVASILWTPLLVWFAVIFGEQLLNQFLGIYENYALWIFLGLLVGIWGLIKIIVPMFSHEGRRRLTGAWRRKTHWEFWPMWMFYPPIVIYILYLGLKYRSFTLFTAANPGIDLGGLVGESKSAILQNLSKSAAFIARYAVVEPGESLEARSGQVLKFMKSAGVSYPIILKPDTGERGKEVVKVNSESEINDYLERHPSSVIVQEYAPGFEFGIFYYRYPEDPQGHLFSITDKQFPKITGNGKHTLRRLIIDDKRAICMAPHYFKANKDHLFDVPAAGEEIQLIDIGTHSKGSIFLDGGAIKTDTLVQTFDKISKGFEGFYFGRFDVRTPSIEAFKEGRDFKIVELNGVTSEATHIYDPQNSLFDAYRVLKAQWRIAFEIGGQNRKKGVKPASIWKVIQQITS